MEHSVEVSVTGLHSRPHQQAHSPMVPRPTHRDSQGALLSRPATEDLPPVSEPMPRARPPLWAGEPASGRIQGRI